MWMVQFDSLWFIAGQEYWAADLDMGCRRRTSPIVPDFVGWCKVEDLVLPHAMRNKYYMGVPD